ncbi:MAG: DUF481 domain-containing protein, partial [Bacteroidota bacterium]|nr:DUF481 domain-containing protein [Bacteroidota bacterium]
MCRQNLIKLFEAGIIIMLVFVHLAGMAKGRDKTDKIILLNGNEVTCEIKKVEFGLLTVKTDDMGTLEIKWDKVARVHSTYIFEIELSDGNIYFGKFGSSTADQKLSIVTGPVIKEVDLIQVIAINQIDNRFWSRMDGGMSIGLNLTKANQLLQWNSNFKSTYRARKYYTSLTYAGNYTIQHEQDLTTRQDLSFIFNRNLQERWFALGYTGAVHNTELGLKLRLSLGAGPGKALIQNNRNVLSAIAGLVANREWAMDSLNSVDSNIEGLLSLRFRRFKYDSPKSNISTGLSFFPGLIPWGRY